MEFPVIKMTPNRWSVMLFVVSGLVLMVVGYSVARWYHDRQFDEYIEKTEEKLRVEAEKSRVATQKAEAWERQAIQLEGEAKTKDEVIKLFGEKGLKAQEAANEEMVKLEQDFAAIGTDVPDDIRQQRIRERLRRLYPAKP